MRLGSRSPRMKQIERRGRLPLPEDGYDWHSEAVGFKLTPKDLDQIEKQKFAIGPTQYRQSFEP